MFSRNFLQISIIPNRKLTFLMSLYQIYTLTADFSIIKEYSTEGLVLSDFKYSTRFVRSHNKISGNVLQQARACAYQLSTFYRKSIFLENFHNKPPKEALLETDRAQAKFKLAKTGQGSGKTYYLYPSLQRAEKRWQTLLKLRPLAGL